MSLDADVQMPIMYHNIPMELREWRQWVCWRYETVNDRITKVPYVTNGQHKANINDPATWGTFDEACNSARAATMDGIGFVLTENDPYTGIDIDDKQSAPASDAEREAHVRILEHFKSYTERSVGGAWVDEHGNQRGGYHIIIRGKLAGGRDRGHVGVYSSQRYLTFTGDVVRNAPIADYYAALLQLVAEMPADKYADELYDVEAILTDKELFEMALNAKNGEKFDKLTKGEWRPMGYASQSEADLALLSIYAFYSRDNEQVRRLFRYSELGKREKATKNNVYLDRTLKKIRAKQATPTDFEAAQLSAKAIVSNAPSAALPPPASLPGTQAPPVPAARAVAPPAHTYGGSYTLPPGLVGALAQFFFNTAIRPVQEVALAAAIGLVAGVVGRSHNISGTGLNQYILLLAKTGTGKEAMALGIGKLIASVRQTIPIVGDFIGPSAFASGQGLIRALDHRPCFVSILGEFGLTLQALSDPRAPAAIVMLRKVLLDLYGKSGWHAVLQSTAYSDSEKNTKMIAAPAITILAESTPETFYDGIDAGDIADGLIPRFHIIEYKGERPKRNRSAGHAPDAELTRRFADLASVAITTANNRTCAQVQIEPAAEVLLDQFDEECDQRIDSSHNAGETQLWNRAHLKALKLAGLLAVGVNPHASIVTVELAAWAIRFTKQGTEQVIHRFDRGDVGHGDAKQHSELRRVIEEYFQETPERLERYKCKPQFQEAKLIPFAYLLARLNRVAAFYKDRRGAANALRAQLANLTQAEILKQLPYEEAKLTYGATQNLYYRGDSW